MRNLRKVMACVLALVMCLSLLPGTANAAGGWGSYVTIEPDKQPEEVFWGSFNVWDPVYGVARWDVEKITGTTSASEAKTVNLSDTDTSIELLPVIVTTCAWCGSRIYDLSYVPDYYSAITIQNTNEEVVGDFNCKQGTWSQLDSYGSSTFVGAPCLEIEYTAKQAGTAVVTIDYWVNFAIEAEEFACSYCYRGQGNDQYVANDYDWHHVQRTVTITVENDDPIPPTPAATYTVKYTDGVAGEIVFADQKYEELEEGTTTPDFVGSTDRPGYTFMGWNPAVNSVVSGDDADDNGEIVYTATWKAENPTPPTPATTEYTVKREYYMDNKMAANVTGKQDGTVGESITGSALAAANSNWNTRTVEGKSYAFTYTSSDPASFELKGDGTDTITLRYDYTTPQTYNYVLTYDSLGGTAVAADSYSGSETSHEFTVTSANPTKDGYTFEGWMDTADGTAVQYYAGDTITLTSTNPTKTVYAKWACAHTQGSDGFCTEADCDHGSDCTCGGAKPTSSCEHPEKNYPHHCGHTDCDNENCMSREHVDANGDHICDICNGNMPTTTPVPETTYTVTFCANGGTFGSSEHVVYSSLKAGETVNVPANPTRDGYTFNGWAPAVQQGFVTVTGNETYYAQWTEIVVPEPTPEYHLSDALAFRNENRQQIGGVFLTEGVVWNDGDADVTNVDFELTLPAIVKLQEDSTITIISTGSEELSADDIVISDYDEVNGTTLTWHLDKFEKGASLIISLTAEGVKAGKFTATLYTTSDEFGGLANSNARSAVAGVLYATAEGTVICPSNEHKWSETSRTEATCGASGSVNYVCAVCDETKTETIPATGHSMVETSRVASTCAAAGSVTSTCSKCSHTETNSLPLAAHTPGAWVTVREPAVGVEGLEEQHCTVCDALLDSRTIPALDEEETPCAHEHTTTAVTKAASCEAAGEQTVTCDDCGALVATNPIPATGHSWDAGTVTTAATATTDGVRTYVCRNDPSHTRTETIPATGVITTPTPVDPTPADPTPAAPAPADPTPAAPAETDVPDAETPLDAGTDIQDGETPLAGAFGLDNANHFAYMLGYGDGTIRPEANITRAEVATIFFRLMTDEFRSANWATENDFSDVSLGQWFNNAISTSANAGKLGGYGDGSFRPNNNITRAEFAAIAVRFLSDEVQGVSGGSFKDTEGHWAAVEIGRAAAAGWITGYGDGTFRPDEYITRAEAAAIINRMLGRVPDAEHLLDEMTVWSDNPATQWYYADIQEATNSHAYDRDELGVTEMWTALQETRDWQALESQWAAQAE